MAEAKKKEEAAKPAPASKAPKEVTSEKPHAKKVGKMTYSELEAAIAVCEKTMGGLWSQYGLSLKAHRDAMGHAPAQFRKAA